MTSKPNVDAVERILVAIVPMGELQALQGTIEENNGHENDVDNYAQRRHKKVEIRGA